MKTKDRTHKFNVGNYITFKEQTVRIEAIDYIDNKYIFDKELIYSLSKFTSMEFKLADSIFAMAEKQLMRIVKRSSMSGEHNYMDLDITEEQLDERLKGAKVQDCFPNLTKQEREFMITGMTLEEQKLIFGE